MLDATLITLILIGCASIAFFITVGFSLKPAGYSLNSMPLEKIRGSKPDSPLAPTKEEVSKMQDEKESVITFSNEGQDIGNGIMRYGHYCNGALMGYVLCGVTEFGGDYRPRHPLDILEKFVEHQRKNDKVTARNVNLYVDEAELTSLSDDEQQKRLKDLRELEYKLSDKDFIPVLSMRLDDKGLKTKVSINGRDLSHMYTDSKHMGKPKTNLDDASHLQELHIQFHRYILKVIHSGSSSDRG